ncbi:nuclear transport factor 2 family protein [Sulfuriferula nivalis]|uniref:Transcriptional regulator n=1 Tax=Sulfuriferula nivalis TaxID=2675298 RepID=A0A809S2K5_9PROT|nr:nuclear transport factor 2 family protein [Sulfuriferula nivalis]BBP00898.1 transcriptional regulator [Sulfuriferula nivalis]
MNLDALIHYYENLTLVDVEDMGNYYADDAYFRDPFNEVNQLSDIQGIFRKMYQQVDEPSFQILERYISDNGVSLTWNFNFRLKTPGKPLKSIHGLTLLHFNDAGKVTYHRDCWDAAHELYEQLPGIGLLFGFMRKIIGH